MSAQASIDVLIAAAHRVELGPLSATLSAAPGASSRAERGGVRFALAEIGVGMTSAGSGMQAALQRVTPRVVVLVGSFGAYPERGASIGSLLAPSELVAVEEATLASRAAMPSAMRVRAQTDDAIRTGLLSCAPGAQTGALATTLSITTDDDLAHTLGVRSGCVGENLEALCVAVACEAASVPFAALLACTNEVGGSGRSQWLAEHARAAEQTCAAVLAFLDRGAPGLRRS